MAFSIRVSRPVTWLLSSMHWLEDRNSSVPVSTSYTRDREREKRERREEREREEKREREREVCKSVDESCACVCGY